MEEKKTDTKSIDYRIKKVDSNAGKVLLGCAGVTAILYTFGFGYNQGHNHGYYQGYYRGYDDGDSRSHLVLQAIVNWSVGAILTLALTTFIGNH